MVDRAREPVRRLQDLSDLELMEAFQGGDSTAFDVLVRRYQDAIINYAFRFVGNYEDACDIAQETFLRLFKNRMLYQPIAKFSTWLYTIAGNIARSDLRRRRTAPFSALVQPDAESDETVWEIPDTSAVPDRMADAALIEGYLQEALLKIPPVYRDVIILRDVQDLEYDEIARMKKLPIGTVKSRINRGRLMLQKLLKDVYQQK